MFQTIIQSFREAFFRNATITTRATLKGRCDLDESSPFARFRYLTAMPLTSLCDDDYAWIVKAESEVSF